MSPDEEWRMALRCRIIEAETEKAIMAVIWGEDFEELK